jgi:hypothetical protein
MKSKIQKLKSWLVTGLVAVMAVSGSIAYACVVDNGTTIGCAGTSNYFIVCSLYPFSTQICTGTSAGSTYTDATGDNATGTDDASPWVGVCTATASLASCCGGAVTSENIVGAYGYAYASGYACP